MPNLTPRKDEVRRVMEVLESTEFDSGEAMAKAVIKEVHSIFEEREWTALLWKAPGVSENTLSLAWGPFTSETEAVRFAKRLDAGGLARALPLSSVGMMEAHIATTATGKAKNCPNCDHPVGTHMHERAIGRCMVVRCKCKSLAKKEVKK